MEPGKFDSKKLNKLNQPERYLAIPLDRLWDILCIGEKGTLIDIGAGTGFFSIPMARYLKKGKVVACDISAE